jgi:hypothetical protein
MLAACGGKGAAPTTPTPATSNATTTAGTFELGEITVFEGSDAVLKIHTNGSTEIARGSVPKDAKPTLDPGPTLKPDGTLEEEGKAVARITSDGTLASLGDNKPTGVHVDADAFSFDAHDGSPVWKMSLASDGKLTMPVDHKPDAGEPAPDMHVTGADTPGKRRATLAMMSIVFLQFPRGD